MASWWWLHCRSGSGGCSRLSPFEGQPAAAPRESWRTTAGPPRAASTQWSPLGGWPATADKLGPASAEVQAPTEGQPVLALVSACGAFIAPDAVVVGALPVQCFWWLSAGTGCAFTERCVHLWCLAAMRSPKTRGLSAPKPSPFLPKTSRFLFSLTGHAGEANPRRAVTGVPGLLPRQILGDTPYAALPMQAIGAAPGPATAVDVASHSRGAQRAEPAAPAARLPSRLSGRGSSIQDAYGSSCLGRGRGGRSGATRGEDAIRSGDSWSIAAAPRLRKAIAKTQPSASRQLRSRKGAGGALALAAPPLQAVSLSPPPLPSPPTAGSGKPISRLGEGAPRLGLGDDHDDGGSFRSRQRLVTRTRPSAPRCPEWQSVVGPADAADIGGAGDPTRTAVAGPAQPIVGRVAAAADPDPDAAIERLLRRVNAKEQQMRERWSHLSAFLGAASDFRSLVADCEQYVGLLKASADQFRTHAEGARRSQAAAPVASGQREAGKTPMTVGKRHEV